MNCASLMLSLKLLPITEASLRCNMAAVVCGFCHKGSEVVKDCGKLWHDDVKNCTAHQRCMVRFGCANNSVNYIFHGRHLVLRPGCDAKPFTGGLIMKCENAKTMLIHVKKMKKSSVNFGVNTGLNGRCPLRSLVTSDPGHFGPETELDIQFGP